MVIREEQGRWLCIPQPEHAGLAGQLARAWGNERFPAPEPRAEVCLAAARHDDGMERFDASPERDPETGLPRGFMRMPLALWLDCWRRGPLLVAEESAYAGLLVALHGLHLLGYRRLDDDDPEGRAQIDAYRAEQDRLVAELIERCRGDGLPERSLERDAIERNRALVSLWDAMSLAICMPRLPDGWEVSLERGSVTVEMRRPAAGERRAPLVAVDPWPFDAAEVPVEAAGRPLGRRFDDEEPMRRALAAADPEALRATLVPAEA